jgi:hypothetical protein
MTNFASISNEDPRESWLRLQYAINDYWTGELYQIDDKIYLAHSRPTFGGLRWWFVCPRLKRRVRKLYLPLVADTFGPASHIVSRTLRSAKH